VIKDSRRVGVVLLVAAVAIVLAFLFADRISRKMPDLAVYWTAASRARAAAPLYRVEDGHYQFKYLPAFAVLAAPLSIVSLESAKAIWFVTSLGLLTAVIVLSLRFLPERRKSTWLLVSITLVVMLKFYGHELVLGQMNALFAVIVAAAVVALRDGRDWSAGAFIALAIVVKPYAVIFLPWLLLRRERISPAPGLVEDGVDINGTQPHQRGQRLHRGHVGEVDWRRDNGDDLDGCHLSVGSDGDGGGVSQSKEPQVSRRTRGGPAAHPHPASLAAGVGLRLSRLDAGDHAAGQLRRPADARAAVDRTHCPGGDWIEPL
jgi:hypothetical protein